jgi:hypothetical protein
MIKHTDASSNLSKEVTESFIKRWRALEKQQADLDFARSLWAKELRACFNKGQAGDSKFLRWCQDFLGSDITFQAGELLKRATLVQTIDKPEDWNRLGGFREIRKVLDLPTEKDRSAVLQAASKPGGYRIATLVRNHQIANAPPAKKIAPLPVQDKVNAPARGMRRDIQDLAQYIAKNCKNLPPDIRVIVDMYR